MERFNQMEERFSKLENKGEAQYSRMDHRLQNLINVVGAVSTKQDKVVDEVVVVSTRMNVVEKVAEVARIDIRSIYKLETPEAVFDLREKIDAKGSDTFKFALVSYRIWLVTNGLN